MKDCFNYVWQMVCDLRSTSSTLDKQEIIKNYCEKDCKKSEFAKNILLYTYHPLWQYNVTSENIKKKSHIKGKDFGDIYFLLNALKDRQITGHDAIGAINTFIENNPEHEELVLCVIDKDLKTRAGDKIINKAISNWIPEFSVALADKYEPKLVNWKDGWYVSRKLDGVRCICIIDSSGNPTFYSRTGKSFDTLDAVADGIASLNLSNVVLDGELCLINKDGNEDFQGIMKELRKKDHVIKNPLYKIFDMICLEDFNKKKSKSRLSERLNQLKNIMDNNSSPYISLLDQEKVQNDDHFVSWTGKANENSWEGLMLRLDTYYKGKRSKDLLKYKNFYDNEYKVLDVEFGPFRYVKEGSECEEEMLSCVYIEHKGHTVKVGSGFTIEQRKRFYQNPDLIRNKVVQVQYFEETRNQEGGISLRFPTFKYLYGTERAV